MGIFWQIVLQLVLIALNAVFACAEIAVISINDAKLAKLAQEGDKRAIRLAKLTSQPARFLATIQVAITLAGFLGSAFAADYFAELLTEVIVSWNIGLSPATIDTIALILITLILSYLTWRRYRLHRGTRRFRSFALRQGVQSIQGYYAL